MNAISLTAVMFSSYDSEGDVTESWCVNGTCHVRVVVQDGANAAVTEVVAGLPEGAEISHEEIHRRARELNSESYRKTGGPYCARFVSEVAPCDGSCRKARSDFGDAIQQAVDDGCRMTFDEASIALLTSGESLVGRVVGSSYAKRSNEGVTYLIGNRLVSLNGDDRSHPYSDQPSECEMTCVDVGEPAAPAELPEDLRALLAQALEASA